MLVIIISKTKTNTGKLKAQSSKYNHKKRLLVQSAEGRALPFEYLDICYLTASVSVSMSVSLTTQYSLSGPIEDINKDTVM